MIRAFLYCDDAYFVNAFSGYVTKNSRDLSFYCFSDLEKARSFYQMTKIGFNVLICEKTFFDLTKVRENKILLVSDKSSFADTQEKTINIFQPAPSIIADIKAALSLTEQINSAKTRIVPVISVQGGSGRSTIAYALAVTAVRNGRQAMYFNLEEVPSTVQLYKHQFHSEIDNLIYKLQEGADIAPILLETMERDENGVQILPPFHSLEDMLSLSDENIEELLEVIDKKASIDYLFLDVPSGFHRIAEAVMKRAGVILQVFGDTPQGREKLEKINQDGYMINLSVGGALLTVLNRAASKEREVGIDAKLPHSNSLQNGEMVAKVLDKNPSYFKSCCLLLELIR